MACRDCIHLVVPPDADGKRRIRNGYSYACDVPAPDIVFPDSILRALTQSRAWPARPAWMDGADGADCIGFKKR